MPQDKPAREVGFPDGQFMAHGVDEDAALQLTECWKQGNHDKAAEIIAELPEKVQPVTESIYERISQIQPREGLFD